MGASIRWCPERQGKSLNVGLRSDFVAKLELPRVFDAGDIDYLRGMADCGFETEAITALIDGIRKFGPIKVWAVY